VAPAANAISAAAAPYRPENPKKLQDQWLKDELGRRFSSFIAARQFSSEVCREKQ
jgi:hypothetical protein